MKDIFKYNNGIFNIQKTDQKIQKYEKIRMPKKILKERGEDTREEPVIEPPAKASPPPEDVPAEKNTTNTTPQIKIKNVFDLIDSMLGGTPQEDSFISELLRKIKSWGNSKKINFGNLEDKHADNLIDRTGLSSGRALPEPQTIREPVTDPEKDKQARVQASLSSMPADIRTNNTTTSAPEKKQTSPAEKVRTNPKIAAALAPQVTPKPPENNDQQTNDTVESAFKSYTEQGGKLSKKDLYNLYIEEGGDPNEFYAFASFIDSKVPTMQESKYIKPRQPQKIVRHPSLAKW